MAPPRGGPLVRRAQADADVVEAIDHYLTVSASAAEGFIDSLEAAYSHIRRHPRT
jgi:plasmid stabilization system protein ParE